MDEGTGLVIDQGTASGTSSDSATNNGTWVNGSLKVNGAARVLDNGSVL